MSSGDDGPAQAGGRRAVAESGEGAGRGARAAGAAAMALGAASLILFAVVMALGPSATVPRIGARGAMWWLTASPSAAVVTALDRAGLLVGGLAVATGLAAVRRGWRPRAWLLLGAGGVAAALYVFLPPAGSIDVLNYAIYGRIASLGHNPYLMPPVELYHRHDPVGMLAPARWRTMPTIYGPVATAAQWAAARLGGASMARIVFWIRLGNAVAFVATAAGLILLAGTDRARQARACLLWAVNPLMLFWLVGSGHVDVMLALCLVAALLTIRSCLRGASIAGAAATGVLAGLATAIKTPFVVAAAGLAWAARRSPRAVAVMLACAAAVLVPAYLVPGALNSGALGRRLTVSAGFIYSVPAAVATRPGLFAGVVLAATAALALLLLWRLPDGYPDLPAVRPVLAFALAWLMVFPVQAPWYDALVFPLAALMPRSRLDGLLILRCVLLSEMLLPGVLPNSGSASLTIAHLCHLGLFVVFGALICMSAFRFWGAPPASDAVHATRLGAEASGPAQPDKLHHTADQHL